MIEFTFIDNGNVPDRWPHTEADILPSTKVIMKGSDHEIGHSIITPSRNRITSLFIEKNFRGKGYGEQFFQYLVSQFQITNFSVSPYDGLESYSRLIAWHERHGFVPYQAIEMVKK